VVDAVVTVSVYTELTTVELWVLDGHIRRNFFGEGKTLKLTIARILRYSNVVIHNVATRIKNIKNVTRCRDSRSAKTIETR